MAYWWINQGITYKEEKAGSFLWAPKLTANGKKQHHWERMYNIKEGDIVFSYANAYIKAYKAQPMIMKDHLKVIQVQCGKEMEIRLN